MKDCSELVERIEATVPDVPREFSNVIINGVANAVSTASAAVRNYGSVYGQNQMLEYSTDGKISDVTNSFPGRPAISDSVLAGLKNELTIIKNNYDRAWATLPQQAVSGETVLSTELSASFVVGSAARAPDATYSILLGSGSNRLQIAFWEGATRVGDLYVNWTNAYAPKLEGSLETGVSLNLATLMARMPGSISLKPDGATYDANIVLYGSKQGDLEVSLAILYLGGQYLFHVATNGHIYTFCGGSGTTQLSSVNLTAIDVANRNDLLPLRVPEVIRNGRVSASQASMLTYSVPEGDSTIVASETVEKTVQYSIPYNAIRNESDKIQSLINAIP